MRRVPGSRTGSFHTRVKRESEEESNRTKLALQMKELYWTRGAQMGLHTMIRQMCLKEEFWLGGSRHIIRVRMGRSALSISLGSRRLR